MARLTRERERTQREVARDLARGVAHHAIGHALKSRRVGREHARRARRRATTKHPTPHERTIREARRLTREIDVKRRQRRRLRHVRVRAKREALESATHGVPSRLAAAERARAELVRDPARQHDARRRRPERRRERRDGRRARIDRREIHACRVRARFGWSAGRRMQSDRRTACEHAERACRTRKAPRERPRRHTASLARSRSSHIERACYVPRVDAAQAFAGRVHRSATSERLAAGGKSELHRVRCRVTPGGGNAEESATEKRPPTRGAEYEASASCESQSVGKGETAG